ncbi:MAG: Fic family protein [Patescibacteria group bacterium]|nr:Fic family protein [Patescibacteria group bacterium]
MEYLSKQEILDIHETVLLASKKGDVLGVLNEHAFSMLTNNLPLQSNDDFYPGIFIKAAFYVRTIIKEHIFVSGNKRISMAVAKIFLQKNDRIFLLPEDEEVERFTKNVDIKNLPLQEIAEWIQNNSLKVKI